MSMLELQQDLIIEQDLNNPYLDLDYDEIMSILLKKKYSDKKLIQDTLKKNKSKSHLKSNLKKSDLKSNLKKSDLKSNLKKSDLKSKSDSNESISYYNRIFIFIFIIILVIMILY